MNRKFHGILVLTLWLVGLGQAWSGDDCPRRVVIRNGFDTKCGQAVYQYISGVPHHVRVTVVNGKSSNCKVTIALTKESDSPSLEVPSNSDGSIEDKAVTKIKIQCAGEGEKPCKGRYMVEILD